MKIVENDGIHKNVIFFEGVTREIIAIDKNGGTQSREILVEANDFGWDLNQQLKLNPRYLDSCFILTNINKIGKVWWLPTSFLSSSEKKLINQLMKNT